MPFVSQTIQLDCAIVDSKPHNQASADDNTAEAEEEVAVVRPGSAEGGADTA